MMLIRSARPVILSLLVAAGAYAALAGDPLRADTPPELEAIKRLTWRSIGPANQAGRISVIVGIPGDPYTFFVSGANGGIFKTTNGGTTFHAVFDDKPVVSIGAIAIAPSNPNIIYVGTGEENPRNNASIGDGIYKSTDGGEHFTNVGLPESDKIGRIVIDPKNADVAYVAVLGREWGPSEERGLYKTTDGGRSWKRILYIDPQTACSDVDIDPTNANVVYAGMWTYRRYAWHLDSGGGETALYKSTDGGATWKKLTNGIPKMLDRIGVAVAPSEPDIVYMISETTNFEGEVWRSDDAGGSFRVVNKDPQVAFRPFYYADVRVDPADPNRVYSLGGSLWISDDGGRNFRQIGRDVHGDHQAMWIDPLNPKRILEGSDGGFQVSYDRGQNFEVINTVAFTQFYHVNYDMQKPYMLCGGLQDNGTWCGTSNSLASEGLRKNDWFTVGGGDGFFAVPDLKEPWRVYTDLQGGVISVIDTRSGTDRAISPYPNRIGSVGDSMENHKYRYNWNSPIALGPDGQTVYFGGNVLFKSTTHGQSWEVISPDLTTNDKNKQKSSGGPITVDNTAAEFHCTILTIAPSMLDPNVIWVGTDDGNVQVTRDGGKTWTNTVKNIPGLKPNAWIPTIDASPFDAGTAYVAADHHQDDDYAPYAFMTTDYGKTWKSVTGAGLPARGWMHVVRVDRRNRNLFYAGTELGLYGSWDGGGHWLPIAGTSIPAVAVRDVQIHPRDNDVIVATHGRGLYILDDATPLQQLGTAMANDFTLFDIRDATRWTIWGKDGNLGQKVYKADNPPPGAIINYYLKSAQQDDASITIADKAGKTIRTIRGPKEAGVNRTTWDLQYDGPRQVPAPGGRGEGAPAGGGGGGGRGRFGGAGGPFVVPGEYVVKVRAAGKELTKSLKVEMDPRVPVTAADLQAQLEASLTLRDMTTRANAVVERTSDLIQQLTALQERLKKSPAARVTSGAASNAPAAPAPQLSGAAKEIFDLVTATLDAAKKLLEDELIRPYPSMGYRQYPRLREEIQSLSGAVSRTAARPTDPEMLRLKELQQELDADVAKLNRIQTEQVGKINEAMRNAPFIQVEAIR
jgi:photosystem II stability/assembly factor-like uncharacterized protein